MREGDTHFSNYAAIVPSGVFESTVDQFLSQVIGQLQAERVTGTNLERIWSELTQERQDRPTTRRRKLEALLGRDPDEADPLTIERLAADAELLGERAVEELAANSAFGGVLLTSDDLQQTAQQSGFAASPRDVARLDSCTPLPSPRDVPAWRLGAEAARALRAQERLGTEPISNDTLTRLAGVETRALTTSKATRASLSFALDRSEVESCVVLRSPWRTGRRFELARLLADRIVAPPRGKLHAATRARTYRQKMQRSFAAELLSPFEAVDKMLNGDYSIEAQADAAEHFNVSELTIRTLLVNNDRLERDELEEDLSVAA